MADSIHDLAFHALADSHRRRLLLALLERNPQADVPVSEGSDPDPEATEALEVKMYHKHLPTLEELGFVTWDREAQAVSKGPKFEEIRPILELLERHRDELPDGWV